MKFKKTYLTYLIGFVLLFAAIFFGFFLTDTTRDKINNTNLSEPLSSISLVNEFPLPDDLVAPSNLIHTTASDEFVYVLEHQNSFIIKADLEGNFIGTISRIGRGPGELVQPLGLSLDNETLYVFEQQKMQVQSFSESGEHLDTYLFDGAYENVMAVDSTLWLTNYYFRDMRDFSDMPNIDENKVFTIYDIRNDSISSAGKIPDIFMQFEISNRFPEYTHFNNRIYVSYKSFPFIFVYDKQGQYLKTIQLKGKGLENVMDTYFNENRDTHPISAIFTDLKVNEKGIFLSTYGEQIEIYHFDFDGNLIRDLNFSKVYESKYEDKYIRNFDIKTDYPQEGTARLFLTVYSNLTRTIVTDINLQP